MSPCGIGIDRRGRQTARRRLPTPRSRSHRRCRHQKYQPRLPRRRSDPPMTVSLGGTPRRSPRYHKSCPRSRTGGPLVCVWHKQAPQHHLPAQARPGWRLAPLDGATQGSADHRPTVPPLWSQAFAATAVLAGVGFVVAVRAALPAADSTAAAASEAPAALAAGVAPIAPRAALPTAAASLLPLPLPLPCALLLSSSSPQRSEARWARASVSRQEKPRPHHPRYGHPSRADRRWVRH